MKLIKMIRDWVEDKLEVNKSRAWRDGWAAREAGQNFEQNPHTEGTAEAADWAEGWRRCDLRIDLQW